jgi:hypothetical protein
MKRAEKTVLIGARFIFEEKFLKPERIINISCRKRVLTKMFKSVPHIKTKLVHYTIADILACLVDLNCEQSKLT